MKSVALKRGVQVKKLEAIMEIGRQENREELHSILMLAEESGGGVTARDVCQKLLLGRPESAGKALLDRCCYYNLLDQQGRLTETGRTALETKMVFIPERGRYLIWYTDDPLIPQRLLDVEPVEETRLHDEIHAPRDPRRSSVEGQNESSVGLPDNLDALESRIFDLFGSEHGQVIVNKIERKVVHRDLDIGDSLEVRLRLSLNEQPSLSLDGKFRRALPGPAIEFKRAWLELLGPNSRHWDDSRNPSALRVPFEGLSEADLASFTTSLPLREPSITRFGSFDDTEVQDVPIVPRTNTDATRWAHWLLLRSIDSYVAKSRYAQLVAEATAKFEEYPNLRLPSQSQLAEELLSGSSGQSVPPEQYWFLRAPLDLDETNQPG